MSLNLAAPITHDALNRFSFERTINEDPSTHSLSLLGSFPSPADGSVRIKAIVRIEKTALCSDHASLLLAKNGLVKKVCFEQNTDIYTWFYGWLGDERNSDVKINVICPATGEHVRKYTKQQQRMVKETPNLYRTVVKSYISSFPPERVKWIQEILLGLSEQSKILFSSPEFVILPDMKWDLITTSSLYLVALVRDSSIRTLRDLRQKHINLLRGIQIEADRIVWEKWGLISGSLRMYVHYQPSYYHFHVHIVNASYVGIAGMLVGQAHLLDDIISLLEINDEIFENITLTYGLGDQHGLFKLLDAANTDEEH